MFGSSTPFGQSSNSPFGSPSVFGQTNNANNNPFAAKPFGSTTSPFGAQTGSSIFGGTSTGVFGTPASSPIGSTSVFGASSSPAFGSSTPAFGATSSPAFGAASSSPFGGSSAFGQKPAFGGFGSTPTSSPFGSSFSQSQPAFGGNQFGSSTFGAGSQPAFGVSSTSAFGVSSTPAFGVSSTPTFGTASTPAFGTTSTPAFGNTGSAFGVSNSPFGSSTPAFGVSSTPAFGVASTPAFGVSTAPTFGAASAPAFGSSPTTTFGASGSAFSFASSPAFGQSTSAFGSSQFPAQSSPFGAQATTPAFGTPNFGQPSFGTQQRAGSRATPYAQTPEADSGTGTQPAGKLESISAMPAYKEKSHEELRWEDYQAGDKGGPNPAGQSSGGMGFNTNNTQSNPFSSSPSFTQPAANPFSSTPSSTNPFAQKTSTFSTPGFAGSTPTLNSSPFATPTNPFASTPAQTPSVFNTTSSNPFGTQTTPSLFGTPNTSSAFGTSTSIFGTTPAQGTTPSFGTGMNFGTQSANLFQSSSPALPQTSSPFGQTGSAFSAPAFGQTGSAFGQPNAFSGNMFSSTPSLQNTSNLTFNQTPSSVPFQSTQPTQNSGFGFGAPAGGIGGTSSIFGQNNNFGQMPTNQSPAVAQPQSITNPFGTLPAMPQMSIGRVGNAPSIQYGISSLPVVDKPAPMRISSVLTSRHLSQSRIRLPARKYHPKNDSPKVSFFSDEEETTSTPKADALFIPRENPRALVIRPLETLPGKASAEKPKSVSSPAQTNGEYTEFASTSHLNGRPTDNGNGNHSENGFFKEQSSPVKITQKTNGLHEDQSTPKSDSYISLTGHRAGEAAIVYEHGADIEALMPKLRHSDYYTEPRIQELAAKERAEPGFCRRVKDFIVGRHNYGSIKFLGETDVRRLDLESLIQFNHREVIVYMDETKKPPVGQGLNKPAEVTLLNIKCSDKKTGSHFTEGPRVEKYKEMLKKKAEDQGAEFVSYDPIKGEWKFRVSHFSRYGLEDDEDMGLAE